MTVSALAATWDPRRCLEVTRYHTWPRLREQSVGEHTCQVLRILLAIWPDAPRNVMVHTLKHDMGEGSGGDPPYPIKKLNPDLKAACDRIERETVKLQEAEWFVPKHDEISEFETKVFKLAEFIEMWEWGLHEQALGNTLAKPVIERCSDATNEYLGWLYELSGRHPFAGDVYSRAVRYVEKRTGSAGL